VIGFYGSSSNIVKGGFGFSTGADEPFLVSTLGGVYYTSVSLTFLGDGAYFFLSTITGEGVSRLSTGLYSTSLTFLSSF
jgi:hypothetical protein